MQPLLKMDLSLKYREIWRLTWPVMLGMLAHNFINLTDTVFLGWVGETELGAAAIGGLFFYGIFVIGFGFSIGTQILISRRNGEGRPAEIGRIFNHSMGFLLLLGVVFIALTLVIAPLILKPALASDQVYQATWEYLKYRIFGIIFSFAIAAFRAFYIGTLRPALVSWSAGLMAVLNILLSWILIFGELGFPAMGIAGAAIASVISEAAGLLFLWLLSLKAGFSRNYGILKAGGFDFALIRHTLEVSVFTMIQNFMAMGAWLIFFIIIEQSGERPLAISNIIRSIYIMLMIPLWAFGTTANTLVSNLMGAGRQDIVLKALRRITLMSLWSTAFVVGIATLLPGPIFSIYNASPDLYREALPVFYMVMAALIMFSIVIPVYSAVSGTGDTRAGMIIEAITIFTYLAFVFTVVIILQQGVVVAWYSEFVYFIVMGSLSWAYLRFGKWRSIRI